jgi:hypothetical protein
MQKFYDVALGLDVAVTPNALRFGCSARPRNNIYNINNNI